MNLGDKMKNLFELFESSFETDEETVKRFKKLVVDQPHDYFGKNQKLLTLRVLP
jgi:hypothetical protein